MVKHRQSTSCIRLLYQHFLSKGVQDFKYVPNNFMFCQPDYYFIIIIAWFEICQYSIYQWIIDKFWTIKQRYSEQSYFSRLTLDNKSNPWGWQRPMTIGSILSMSVGSINHDNGTGTLLSFIVLDVNLLLYVVPLVCANLCFGVYNVHYSYSTSR